MARRGLSKKYTKRKLFDSAENVIFENPRTMLEEAPLMPLNEFRLSNITRIIVEHVNINSKRSTFQMLSDIIKNNIDILVVLEMKLDCSFPNAQFIVEAYASPFEYDRNSYG